MKIFVADGSKFGPSRLMTLIGEHREFEMIGYSEEASGALNAVRALLPQVVILDLDMRGGSGLSLLAQIKQEHPGIAVIVVTNASHDQYRRRCEHFGADYFLDKSTQFQLVPAALRSLASRQTSDTDPQPKNV